MEDQVKIYRVVFEEVFELTFDYGPVGVGTYRPIQGRPRPAPRVTYVGAASAAHAERLTCGDPTKPGPYRLLEIKRIDHDGRTENLSLLSQV